MVDLQSLLPSDHLARVVWRYAERLELSAMYASIAARDDQPGRPAADPRVLLALWLYATAEGIGSARALARLCESEIAYRWLCGGVPVNHHNLSDFRAAHVEVLDRLLTDSVAALLAAGLVRLDEVVIDGTKVRAHAGQSSYRSRKGLDKYRSRAAAQVARLKAELGSDAGASERRREAAQARAAKTAEDRARAVEAKLKELEAEREARAKTHKKQEAEKRSVKASTTDPDARRMRMADGAVRPAYNLMVAIDAESQMVVALRPTDRRNDSGMAVPLMDEIETRYGRKPERLLADSTMATRADIEALAPLTSLYTPLPTEKAGAAAETIRKRAYDRRHDSEAVQAWRARMGTEAAQVVYKRRSRIETVNANIKHRGARGFSLRGLVKVRAEALLMALAHNLRTAFRLAALAAA